MSVISLLLATAVLCAPTWLWLERMVPLSLRWRRFLIAGYALPLGILATTIGMRLLSSMGIEHSPLSLAGWAAVVMLAGWLAPSRLFAQADTSPPRPVCASNRVEQVVVAICLALIAGRLILLGLELTTRPIFAWDTKQHWGKQAKVFFELRAFAPYVPLQEWLELGGKGVYTNMHPDYPKSTPLLQSFTAIALGEWNDSLVNFFWLLMWAAIGLLVFTQSSVAGARTAMALAGTYMVLSMPYLNTQVALAGYADLMLATCFLGAFVAFYNWSQTQQGWQLTLVLLCGLGGLLVKNEGFYWLLSLLPGFILVRLGLSRGLLVLGGLGLAVVAMLWLIPGDLIVAGHSLDGIALGYRPESWGPLFASLLVHDNWHLTFHAFLLALLVLPILGKEEFPAAAILLSALGLYVALYIFTSNASGAVQFTSLNRVGLQLIPALGFFALVVTAKLCNRQATAIDPHNCSQSPSPA